MTGEQRTDGRRAALAGYRQLDFGAALASGHRDYQKQRTALPPGDAVRRTDRARPGSPAGRPLTGLVAQIEAGWQSGHRPHALTIRDFRALLVALSTWSGIARPELLASFSTRLGATRSRNGHPGRDLGSAPDLRRPRHQPVAAVTVPERRRTSGAAARTGSHFYRAGSAAISAGTVLRDREVLRHVRHSIALGLPAGGDAAQGPPAVAAALELEDAAAMAFRIVGRSPSGTAADRDAAVGAFMRVADNLDAAVETLASHVPGPHSARLAATQASLELACTHLREALICSAVDFRQPGSGKQALAMRERYPVLPHRGMAASRAGKALRSPVRQRHPAADQHRGHRALPILPARGLYAHASLQMREKLTAALQARWDETLRQRAAIGPHSPGPLLDDLLAPFRAAPAGYPGPAPR